MNTDPEAMHQRTGNPRALGRARLQGWQFRFAFHADIVEMPGSHVDGVLWDISQDHLLALDCREGYPVYYNRKTVIVEHQGQELEAIVYYMNKGEPLAEPSTGYLEMLHRGYTAFSVPKTQIFRALDEAAGKDSRPKFMIQNDREKRARQRYLELFGNKNYLNKEIIEDPHSKYYGRDLYSLNEIEWLDYDQEQDLSEFSKFYSS